MKKPFYLTIALVIFALSACANAGPQSAGEAIRPGDKVGDFVIATGAKGDKISYMTLVHCPVSGETETCEFPVGTKVNVSNSMFSPPASGKSLDEIWAHHTYEMRIENRPVDLQAFGSIDIFHPMVGSMRNWNVIVTSDKPGKVTVDFSGAVEGESYQGTFVVIFKTP